VSAVVDDASTTRAGEELDVEKLRAYLREHAPTLTGDLEIKQFPKGHSNLTYLLRVGGTDLVLRRPPFGSKVKSAHDMGREHRILSRLAPIYPKAPRPIVYCEDDSVLGAPFYVMERIEGVILRKELPPGMTLSADEKRAMDEALIDGLVELHSLDYAAAGLSDLGKPDGYVERQVQGWTKRYDGSKTDEIPAVPKVAKWLDDHRPVSPPATLIHNDYKYDNVVLDPNQPTKLRGVLDWEMSTLGDPLMDLGTSLSYWIDPADDDMLQTIRWSPTTIPGSLTRRELADRYAEKTGRDVSNILFYYAFGLFKTAVVLQQIYYRYKQGLTKDPRFAPLIMGVHVLVTAADRAIEAGRI
jgi:aminoglycoside phosphotransferase (APT) family kinase protein